MKAQVTAIAIMALMALSTPGTMADNATAGSESDAQCLMGEPVGTIYDLFPEVIQLQEDPRDVVCELDDGTVLECEETDDLLTCVVGEDTINCEEETCQDVVCVAEGQDIWTCTGSQHPCPKVSTCVPDPCENPDDCDVGPVLCVDTDCPIPDPCENPDDCENPCQGYSECVPDPCNEEPECEPNPSMCFKKATGGLGVVAPPEMKGLSEWSIGALLNEGCLTEVTTPMVPFYADIGAVHDGWSISIDGDAECKLVGQSGADDYEAWWWLDVTIAGDPTYSGRLPFSLSESVIEFSFESRSTRLGPYHAFGENAGGTSGSGKTLCEAQWGTENARAYAAAYAWISSQYADLSAHLVEASATVSLISDSGGGYIITTPRFSGRCELAMDPLVSWSFDCWFTIPVGELTGAGPEKDGPNDKDIVMHATGETILLSPSTGPPN